MNNQDKINFIREKCIQANSDIRALKIGCEVERKEYNEWDEGIWYVVAGTAICPKHKKFRWECYDECDPVDGVEILEWTEEKWSTFRLKQSEIEILGRPVRLADVLLAIPHVKPMGEQNMVRGQAESHGNVGFVEAVCRWNLRADDLREQSEETIKFIAELLVH